MWQQFGEFQTSMHDGARRPSDWPGHVQSPRRSAVQSSPLHDEHDPNEDVHITGVQYILMDHPEISKVALETIRSLSKQWVKEEPAPDNETVDRDIGIGCLATASAESTGAEFAGSLNRDLLHDLLRSRQCRYQQLDPAQDAGATRRWSCFMKWYAIDEPRFRASHDKVSPRFTHGAHAHAGMYVADLVESFMRDEEKPEGLTPLVAAGWHGGLYVVFGNRRLWALQQYKDRHGPWTGRTPQIRVIMHQFPIRPSGRWFSAHSLGRGDRGSVALLRPGARPRPRSRPCHSSSRFCHRGHGDRGCLVGRSSLSHLIAG